jgi:tetratricopeptide (TPR) repeat protein
VEVDPESWVANNNLGNALLKAGRTAEGMAYVTRAYGLNSFLRFDLHIRTGDLLARQGLLREALASYRKARQLIPYDRSVGEKIADVERRLAAPRSGTSAGLGLRPPNGP